MGEKQRILKVSDSHVPEVISTKACARQNPVGWRSVLFTGPATRGWGMERWKMKVSDQILLQSKVFFSLENKKSLWRLESWRMQTVWVLEIFTEEEWRGCELDKRGRQFSATWPRSSVSWRFSLTKHGRGEQLAQERTMFFIPGRSSSMHLDSLGTWLRRWANWSEKVLPADRRYFLS